MHTFPTQDAVARDNLRRDLNTLARTTAHCGTLATWAAPVRLTVSDARRELGGFGQASRRGW